MDRKTLIPVGLLLCGTVIGLLLAESLGRIVQLRAGQTELSAYADRLQQTAIQIDAQSEHVINTVLNDRFPFCSDEEIRLMRGLVYSSSEIKDIGRLQDEKLFCTSEMGQIKVPFTMPAPNVSFRNMSVYAWVPIGAGFGENARGFIVRVKAVDIILNPAAFDALREPTRSFAAFIYDRPTGTLLQGFGDPLPLSRDDIVANKLILRSGIYYRPRCSAKARICIVAAESRKAILARSEPLHEILLIAGALLGNSLVLSLLLFYRRHRSHERQLRRALRRGDLTVVYQPIVHLDTFTIAGAEVLVRWTNEQGNPVSPDFFVSIAEDKGFVNQITSFVLHSALAETGDLLEAGDFRLTINISAQDLADEHFSALLQSAIDSAGVLPSTVGLELTERSTTNQQAAIATIARLRQAGHTVYIDDFGTGYSSLAYLRDLAVDAIKIDRTFTATVGTDSITEPIIPQILYLAEQLHLGVVVEGIETSRQAEYFRAAGKGFLGQGWHFSRPVPAARLRELVRQSDLSPLATPSELIATQPVL